MVKILVIEKETNSITDLCDSLEHNGFGLEITIAEETTMAQLRCISYAMILCELSAMDFKEVKTFIQNQNAPILWLVEQNELPKSVRNFRMGMEDYIVKPVGTTELLARIHMLMRCAGIDTGKKLHIGLLFLDTDARAAVVDGKEIPLTMREFDIIFGMLSAPEKVFTRK